MTRFIIIERKRVIPLILLIVLLGGLTLYDSFRDDVGEVAPVKDEEAKETKAVEEKLAEKITEEMDEEGVEFVTADIGFRVTPKTFKIARDLEEWVDIMEEKNLSLPDYPYNEYTEVGLFGFNSKIKDIEVEPGGKQLQVRVTVRQKDDHYHIVSIPREELVKDAKIQNWRILNEKGEAVYQMTTELE